MTTSKHITIPDELAEYIEINNLNLSWFVQEKLLEHKEGRSSPLISYDNIMNVLKTSSFNDWVYDDEFGIFTYKHDVNLCIKTRWDRENDLSLVLTAIQQLLGNIPSSQHDMLELASFHDAPSYAKYEADWIENFPDKNATRMHTRIFYSASFVTCFLFILVDGAREIIPAPTVSPTILGNPPLKWKYTISKLKYNLGKILRQSSDDRRYKEQLNLAGIRIQL